VVEYGETEAMVQDPKEPYTKALFTAAELTWIINSIWINELLIASLVFPAFPFPKALLESPPCLLISTLAFCPLNS
jgi:hypothetical protein